jgi:hypothetical protein
VNFFPPDVRAGARQVGPIEFWRIPDLTKVREVFTANDAIDSTRPDASGRIVVIRDDKAWLANFDTGELLEELPGVETEECSRLLFKDRLFWVHDNTTYIYDLSTKQVLASYPDHDGVAHMSDTLTVLRSKAYVYRGDWALPKSTVLNTATGQPDHRFEREESIEKVELSPDGRIAVVFTADQFSVCDVSTAKAMWSTPRPAVDLDDIRFEEKSSVLAMDCLDEWAAPKTARWRVATGEVINPVPGMVSGVLDRTPDEQERYALDHRDIEKGRLTLALDRGTFHLRPFMGQQNVPWPEDHQSVLSMHDLKADRQIGVYAYEYCTDFLAPDGLSFVAFTIEDYGKNQLRYYRLPPRRDWWGLLRWAFLPPVLLLTLRWVLSLRRRIVAEPLAK